MDRDDIGEGIADHLLVEDAIGEDQRDDIAQVIDEWVAFGRHVFVNGEHHWYRLAWVEEAHEHSHAVADASMVARFGESIELLPPE